MTMTSGFFRLLPDLPKPFWRYPISYINYGTWAIQVVQPNYTCFISFNLTLKFNHMERCLKQCTKNAAIIPGPCNIEII